MKTSRDRPPHAVLVVENVSLARDHRLQKQARSLLAADFRVSVVCRADPDNARFGDVALCQYPAPPEGNSKLGFLMEYGYSLLMATACLARLWLCERFDVLQISGTPDIYFLAAAPFRLAGVPVVLDQRDLSPELYEVRYRRRGRLYRLLRRLERASYRAADHVLVVNRSLADVAEQRGGVPAEWVTVVGNGPRIADIAESEPDQELKGGCRYLCCWVGLMGPQDQLPLAIDIVDELVHRVGRTDTRFAFIGDGESRAAAQARVTELGLAEHLHFTGWLPKEQVFEYLATADIAVEPNLEDIVTPVKGLEYMAFGVPFVSFDVTETARIAGDAAVRVPRGDVAAFAAAIDSLLDDPQRREHMARAGQRLIHEQLSWDHQSIRYLEVLQALGARRRRQTDSLTTARGASAMASSGNGPAYQPRLKTRARTILRARVSEFPWVYLSFARRKYPGPSPEVVGRETQLLIDGYTRSASTYAVYGLQLAQEHPVRMAHHLHAAAQVVQAVRWGIPTLVLVREPRGAVLSQVVREPGVAVRDCLAAYVRYHERLLPYRERLVVADFETVTHNFREVVQQVNTRFGMHLDLPPADGSPEVFDFIAQRARLSQVLLAFESGTVSKDDARRELEALARRPSSTAERETWMPSTERQRAKDALAAAWDRPVYARLRARAESVYQMLLDASDERGDSASVTAIARSAL
jgi:glycosyltransferase involved in cell wall biosynthesis